MMIKFQKICVMADLIKIWNFYDSLFQEWRVSNLAFSVSMSGNNPPQVEI
jgi:hypothetical protein